MLWAAFQPGLPGCGPRGSGRERRPLPLATSNWRPSGVTRTEVGYQPTGMNPSDRLLPMTLTSKTAMLLLFALATNNLISSGDSEASSVWTVRPVEVSRTVTVFRFALATKRRRPDFVSAISLGCSPVGQR